MIGIDTNILIRYLVQDDEAQVKISTDFIESTCTSENPGFINNIVLCEVSWVLASAYKQVRANIAEVIDDLLQVREIEVQEAEVVWKALQDYCASNADFADHLIAQLNLQKGCRQTVTLDRKAGLQIGVKLLD